VERLAHLAGLTSLRELDLLQCGHGGELRGKGGYMHALTHWRESFNAATEGNSVERENLGQQLADFRVERASMRPRRGTPWKVGSQDAPAAVAG